ncbi:MAG TPA: radical SAM protein, partial [Hydrogenothermaceae bacterium]|nr:radical SAM protein [Hydrogenothermaceae bacterium]
SRRFGVSLGIDLSPEKKSCNFDCLYCELGKGKPTDNIYKEPNPEEILKEIKDFLSKNRQPDYITITANGEPTLYSRLDNLIGEINKIKTNSKTLILSNSSTIYKENIQKTLTKFDTVKLSLDAVSEEIFRKVDKPLKGISIHQIIKGIKNFRKIFKGKLIIEVLIVKFINDDVNEIKKLSKVLKELNPDRIDLGTIDRPPAYRVFPVSNKQLYEFAEIFEKEYLPINVVERKDIYIPEFELTEVEIINTLKKRPLTIEDIENIFSFKTLKRIEKLEEEGKIERRVINGKEFLRATI